MNVCTNSDILKVIYFCLIIVDIIKIVIPIALIIYGLIDFSKAVINSDEKVQKKSVQLFIKRILYGILVFAVPWIIEVLMVTLGNVLGEEGTINFTDCLDNANSTCLDAMDSKNITAIRSACDVPSDYKIEEDTISNNNGIVTSDKNITFNYEWVTTDVMPYALYTPSSANNNDTTPLIVWLHGSGEVNSDEKLFKNRGLPAVLNNWKLEGFNAYVLCPRASGDWINHKSQVFSLIDKMISEKTVNTNKIILVGHSSGGIGVEAIAKGKTNRFSALVVLSGYDTGVDISQFKNLAIRGYVGDSDDPGSFSYMNGKFKNTFGSNNLFILNGIDHGSVPRVAFNLDNNNDNKSDLIEWMLSQ